jgi:hypothetical protein
MARAGQTDEEQAMLHHRLDHERCDRPSNRRQRASTMSQGLRATSRIVSSWLPAAALLLCRTSSLSLCTTLFNLRVHKL